MSEVDCLGSAFGGICLSLLKGGFICRHSADAAFHYLSDEANFLDMHRYLSRMGMGLRRTDDGEAIYAAYLDADSSDRRTAISKQFRQTINSLSPLVKWLQLVMACLGSSSTIAQGDVVKEGALLSSIEGAPALTAELNRISAMPPFSVKVTAPKLQLSKVMQMLVEMGYLKRAQEKGSVYVATGKWSYFYEVLDFIAEHEHIDVLPEEQSQQELLQ